MIYSKKEVVHLIVETAQNCLGDEWIPQMDDIFLDFLDSKNLLDVFNEEFPLL
jgi:hypothetical protein